MTAPDREKLIAELRETAAAFSHYDTKRLLLRAAEAIEGMVASVSVAQQVADAFTPGGGGLILSIGGVEAERRLVALKEALAATRRSGG